MTLPSPLPQRVRVQRWEKPSLPSEQEAEARLHQEGYDSFRWHDVPGSTYPLHRHKYDECLWILKGEITFSVTSEAGSEEYPLKPGDRLYIPAKTPHTAIVPRSSGVTYLVGQKKPETLPEED